MMSKTCEMRRHVAAAAVASAVALLTTAPAARRCSNDSEARASTGESYLSIGTEGRTAIT